MDKGRIQTRFGDALIPVGGFAFMLLIGAIFISSRNEESEKQLPAVLSTGWSISAEEIVEQFGGQPLASNHTPLPATGEREEVNTKIVSPLR